MKPQIAKAAFRFPVEIKDWLEAKAKSDDRTMNSLVTHILRKEMQTQEAAA